MYCERPFRGWKGCDDLHADGLERWQAVGGPPLDQHIAPFSVSRIAQSLTKFLRVLIIKRVGDQENPDPSWRWRLLRASHAGETERSNAGGQNGENEEKMARSQALSSSAHTRIGWRMVRQRSLACSLKWSALLRSIGSAFCRWSAFGLFVGPQRVVSVAQRPLSEGRLAVMLAGSRIWCHSHSGIDGTRRRSISGRSNAKCWTSRARKAARLASRLG
jgi:hypothetical protein